MLRTSEFVLNSVLNSGWQIAAIFAVAAPASWLLKNGPARYRHTLWIIAFATCLVVPLLTATRFVPAWISSEQVVTPQRQNLAPIASAEDDIHVDHIGIARRKTVTTTPRGVLLL